MKEISKKHGLGNFEDNNINKLEVLQTANLYDLIIPETLITSFRTKLHSTIKENQKSITKAIRNGGYYNNSDFIILKKPQSQKILGLFCSVSLRVEHYYMTRKKI